MRDRTASLGLAGRTLQRDDDGLRCAKNRVANTRASLLKQDAFSFVSLFVSSTALPFFNVDFLEAFNKIDCLGSMVS